MQHSSRQLYIKLKHDHQLNGEPAHYHIHVDAREEMPASCVDKLLGAGFFYDFFDHEYRIKGLNGDPTAPFPSYAPLFHFTFVTSSTATYRKQWQVARDIVSLSHVACYLEGELIILDEPLSAKPFDQEEYELTAPRLNTSTADPFKYVSAIDNCLRSLPAVTQLRRLDPVRNGPRDRFRVGEVHLSLRDDTNPRLLELLCNLGFSVPAIPKLVETVDGTLETHDDGTLKIIHDIPLTLQATNMFDVVRITNLAVTIISRIGGVEDGSIKLERAINFEVFNGLDYNDGMPPVISNMIFRDDFSDIQSSHIGSRQISISELGRTVGHRAKFARHIDKKKIFDQVWQETEQRQTMQDLSE
jgi:hypothetical protein